MKKYIVNIDKKWSEDIVVTAKNPREARKKAFDKFANRKLKPKDFNINESEI